MFIWLGIGGLLVIISAYFNSQTIAWQGLMGMAAFSTIAFGPSWPWLRKQPIQWLGKEEKEEEPKTNATDKADHKKNNNTENVATSKKSNR
jgi:hypothetical protein